VAPDEDSWAPSTNVWRPSPKAADTKAVSPQSASEDDTTAVTGSDPEWLKVHPTPSVSLPSRAGLQDAVATSEKESEDASHGDPGTEVRSFRH
jgi:hypothetical protein